MENLLEIKARDFEKHVTDGIQMLYIAEEQLFFMINDYDVLENYDLTVVFEPTADPRQWIEMTFEADESIYLLNINQSPSLHLEDDFNRTEEIPIPQLVNEIKRAKLEQKKYKVFSKLQYNEKKGAFHQSFTEANLPESNGYRTLVHKDFDFLINMFCDWYIKPKFPDLNSSEKNSKEREKPTFDELKELWKEFKFTINVLRDYNSKYGDQINFLLNRNPFNEFE